MGDANNNESVNILDVVYIISHIMRNNDIEYPCALDINGDYTIDIIDVVILVNCILTPGSFCNPDD